MANSRPSVMGTHNFSHVPSPEISRSRFRRDHGHKSTFDAGWLIPVFVDDALPGDTLSVNMTALARLATPLHPIMDNMFLESFWFAIPNRLVWENWEKFCGEQDNPGDSTDFVVPNTMSATPIVAETLQDYLGLPVGRPNIKYSVLYERAYGLVFDEWFRDQNLIAAVNPETGNSHSRNMSLQRRGKRHDYFTSCLPFPQKGESLPLPLGSQAPIMGIGRTGQSGVTAGPTFVWETDSTSTRKYDAYVPLDTDNLTIMEMNAEPSGEPAIYADLSNAAAATINELRQSFQVQRLLERDARGGTRYPEIILAHFRVVSDDARLQRPEFLGGGSTMVNINPIHQTVNESGNGLGDLAGIGTASVSGHGFTRSFTEHTIIMGIVCVRADLTYQQGVDRFFQKRTRYDYFWPALQHIGEQSVLRGEIYWKGDETDEEVFGYQERYAEYRYKPSRISGKFQSEASDSLDAWHLSQDFTSAPVLGEEFIKEKPPLDRAIQVPSEPHFLFDAFFRYNCVRPMPLHGVPGNVDRF